MKPIETAYNGYRFRSRLEARAAVLMDEAKIKYIYEPEGFVFEDGTTYLPDFYLPDMGTFLECKGIMNEKDEHKIDALSKETGKEIVLIDSGLLPYVTFHVDNMQEWYPVKEPAPGLITECAFIGKCRHCGKVYFAPINLSWKCRCCGYDDGDSTAEWLFDYDTNPDDYAPIRAARSSRFEFGEAGVKNA